VSLLYKTGMPNQTEEDCFIDHFFKTSCIAKITDSDDDHLTVASNEVPVSCSMPTRTCDESDIVTELCDGNIKSLALQSAADILSACRVSDTSKILRTDVALLSQASHSSSAMDSFNTDRKSVV